MTFQKWYEERINTISPEPNIVLVFLFPIYYIIRQSSNSLKTNEEENV